MAGLAIRFRKRESMSTIEEDQIQLVGREGAHSDSDSTPSPPSTPDPDPSNSNSLQKEKHRVSPLKQIKTKVTSSFTPTKKLISWWVTVVVLGFSSFLLVLVPLLLEEADRQECVDFENVRGYANYEEYPFLFEESVNGKFVLCRRGEPVLEGMLGTNHTPLQEVKVDVYRHPSNTVVNITRLNLNCLRVEWTGLSSRETPIEDCYNLGGAHWYGMFESREQRWPINGLEIPRTPFLPSDYLSDFSSVFGPVVHPLWLSSKGSGIHIDEGVQLYYRMNSTAFCFAAEPYELECVPKASDAIYLNYTVCNFDTITETAKYFLNESGYIPHPQAMPNHALYTAPIWSTWAELKTDLNDDTLRAFYSNISDNQFPISQLEIDDGYSDHYGDLAFNKGVSPDVLAELSQSVTLTAWVHPFVNHDADNFSEGLHNDQFLPGFFKDESNSVSLVKWWQGYGAVINFLRNSTSEWHSQRLDEFRTSNHLTSLKFDAGESTYMPQCVYIHALENNPAMFTKAYVHFVGKQSYSDRAEVRSGHFTQDQHFLVRLLDRTSTWGTDNGLKSVLNAVLSLGLGGYGYILPDMIGGNGIDPTNFDSSKPPDIELYIRWLQLNTFLPFTQFSLGPWRYNDDTLMQHVRNMTRLHTEISNEYFIPLSEEVINSGYPIIRPLWWLGDSEAQESPVWTIDSQFLIGEQLMVAPMLDSGNTTRSVYFPMGTNWEPVSPPSAITKCQNVICGDGRTVDFAVGLWDVLYFNKTSV